MKKIKLKLVYKLMASYIMIIAIMAIAITISNSLIASSIDQYFIKRAEASIEEVGSSLDTMAISKDSLVEIEIELRQEIEGMGTSITFLDESDKVLYESKEIKKSEEADPQELVEPKGDSLNQQEFDVPDRFYESTYAEMTFDITYDDGGQGTVVFGYYHRGELNDNDLFLIDKLGKVNQGIIIGIIVVGLFVSVIMSRSITKPIYKISNTANNIREGDLKARTSTDTSTLEIHELSQSIDYLADTLEKEDMLRRQMTSDMAHEIRTPITTIRNFFEAFIDGVWEANEENMTICYNELIRLSKLIDKLKDISNIEETNLKTNNQHFDLSDEIYQIAELFRPQLYKKSIKIYLNTQEDISMYMDKNIFSQIIGNIVSNAYRYTDEGGRVDIIAMKNDSEVIIKIKDNGMGIAEGDQQFIFERFYRTEKSRNRETGGMGVGLTIVKKLVEMYKGAITIESEVGKGTTFTIAFDTKYIS